MLSTVRWRPVAAAAVAACAALAPRPAAPEEAAPAGFADVPVSDVSDLGRDRDAFQNAMVSSGARTALHAVCARGRPPAAGATPAVLVLSVRTVSGAFQVVQAVVRDAGSLEPEQQRCVLGLLDGAELRATGVEAGHRYRFTYPLRLGAAR